MKAVPLTAIKPYLGRAIEAADSVKIINYYGAVAYTIPKLVKGNISAWITDDADYLYLISRLDWGPAPATIFPLFKSSPQEMLDRITSDLHLRRSSVISLPQSYAKVLKASGYKVTYRAWGYRDFVYSTEAIATLRGGQFARVRNYVNRLRSIGVVVRPLAQDEYSRAAVFEDYWTANHTSETVFHPSFASIFLANSSVVPGEAKLRVLGAWLGGDLLGFVIGVKVSESYWANVFRYSNKDYNGLSVWMLSELAQCYPECQYEVDGDARAVGCPLWEYKRRLVTPDVLDKQINMFVVAKK